MTQREERLREKLSVALTRIKTLQARVELLEMQNRNLRAWRDRKETKTPEMDKEGAA